MGPEGRFAKHARIEAILRERLDYSRKRYLKASRRFTEVIQALPLPGPEASDGKQQIRNAAAERRAAFAQYEAALFAFSRFVLEGKIPEDLQP